MPQASILTLSLCPVPLPSAPLSPQTLPLINHSLQNPASGSASQGWELRHPASPDPHLCPAQAGFLDTDVCSEAGVAGQVSGGLGIRGCRKARGQAAGSACRPQPCALWVIKNRWPSASAKPHYLLNAAPLEAKAAAGTARLGGHTIKWRRALSAASLPSQAAGCPRYCTGATAGDQMGWERGLRVLSGGNCAKGEECWLRSQGTAVAL